MSKSIVLFAVVAGSLALVACGDPPPPPNKVAQSAAKTAPTVATGGPSAQETFNTRCGPCHGTSGKGDGPGAAALNPKPRDYTDAAWQKSVTDDQLKKAIIMGGAAVGKSPIMPASPDLESQPAVVDGLVKIVRGFGAK